MCSFVNKDSKEYLKIKNIACTGTRTSPSKSSLKNSFKFPSSISTEIQDKFNDLGCN